MGYDFNNYKPDSLETSGEGASQYEEAMADAPAFDKEAARKARMEVYRKRRQEVANYNDEATADDFYARFREVRDRRRADDDRLVDGRREVMNPIEKMRKEQLEHDRTMAIERQGGEGPLRTLRRMFNRLLNARSIAEKNARNMNEPTLRNIDLSSEPTGLDDPGRVIARDVAEKIQTTGKMEAIDALMLFEPYGIGGSKVMDNAEKFLGLLGMDDGTDFDVKMPSIWYNQDNEPSYTPLQISYKNDRDETVRISFDRNARYSRETGRMEPVRDDYSISAWVGKDIPGVGDRKPFNADPESKFSLGPWGLVADGPVARDIGVSGMVSLDEFAENFRGVQH